MKTKVQNTLPDSYARQQAADVTQSYIVQAPAGSGKTELLIRRYVALLKTVKAPENIVAITFTRKAANEMRERVLQALPDVEINPNRLRIQTIDSLCASIISAAPILSQFGAKPSITDNSERYYIRAAKNLLAKLDEKNSWNKSLADVLLHLDNRYEYAMTLFSQLLSKRDQWLPHIIHAKSKSNLREELEKNLENVIADTLQHAYEQFAEEFKTQTVQLANFAADEIQNDNLRLSIFPESRIKDCKSWQTLADWLLTKTGQWRKQVNKKIGFPSNKKTEKAAMKILLGNLQTNEKLAECLHATRDIPPKQYNPTQWKMVDALLQVLPVLAAELKLLFQTDGVVDFIEVSSGALLALGQKEQPTELALNLDYQIQHLLIDEFQDTSITQYSLLEKLTYGWQPGDGRTLFLVGDPMQSIYRFREAEVGLFLRAKEQGIGDITLKSLTLTTNFRANQSLVDWSNSLFTEVFPKTDNISTGAITFSPSSAIHPPKQDTHHFHTLVNKSSEDEAKKVIELIQKQQRTHPEETIAVLVRSRAHLAELIPMLQQANIEFQANEIVALIHCPAIQDILTLTYAMLHPGDRLHWLALLRAPWCGLTLSDLHILANGNENKTLWDNITDTNIQKQLSDDGQHRIKKIISILQPELFKRQQLPLRKWIENIWLALDGPACLTHQYEIEQIKQFFSLLEKCDRGGCIDGNEFEQQLSLTYTNVGSQAKIKLQLMTIHKSKGLEFDCVILPSLHYRSAVDSNTLLMWLERPRKESNDLLLAPIRSAQHKEDKIYSYVRKLNQTKADFETIRLLYVAITRAKQTCHLIAHVNYDEDYQKPVSRSLLNLLWPIWQQHLPNAIKENIESPGSIIEPKKLKRLPINQFNIDSTTNQTTALIENKPFHLNRNNSARYVGTVIHACLEKISILGADKWNITTLSEQKPLWKKQLLELGLPESELDTSLTKIEKTITNVLNNPEAQWILDPTHKEAHSEFPITSIIDNEIRHFVIDRTFIDEKGTRWIIDYKTGTPDKKTIALYQAQLELYAKALSHLSKQPIKTALYLLKNNFVNVLIVD